MEKVKLEELEGPSTSLPDGVAVVKTGRTITLTFALDLEESIGHDVLTATDVRAHAHHTEAACGLRHITVCFDSEGGLELIADDCRSGPAPPKTVHRGS